MPEPGWNPASESFPDHLEGSAYMADRGAPVGHASPRWTTARWRVFMRSPPPLIPRQPGRVLMPCPPPQPPLRKGGKGYPRHARPLARQVLSLLSTVAHGAAVATWQGIVLARRFPRASLASGLSIAILAAVMVLKPGKGEHDTTAQIGSNRHRKRPSTSRRQKPEGDPDSQDSTCRPPRQLQPRRLPLARPRRQRRAKATTNLTTVRKRRSRRPWPTSRARPRQARRPTRLHPRHFQQWNP